MRGGSVREMLAEATARLRGAGSDSPRLDAEVLLQHVLGAGWDRARLYAAFAEPLPPAAREWYAALVARRGAGEPVAYLVGKREFMGRDFVVGPGVLVPRPETECLVEWVLARLSRWPRRAPGPRVVDVGTGSGAIALSLARLLPAARVVAVERSAGALAFARENLARLGPAGRVLLVRGDLLAPLAERRVDAIVANLPYLRPDQLHAGIAREPREALLGGPDGLDPYRALLPQAALTLRAPGLFAAEIDPAQATAMAALCRATFGAIVGIETDLAGSARFVAVERPG